MPLEPKFIAEALRQPKGAFGALVDPRFYADALRNIPQTLGTPLPTEQEGMAMLAQDPRYQSPDVNVARAMTDPGTQSALAKAWSDKMDQVGVLGLTVYHGSPHKFDKFDSAHIGKGEGAQAYGHGLYFAENPKVALDYKKRLTNRAQYDPKHWESVDLPPALTKQEWDDLLRLGVKMRKAGNLPAEEMAAWKQLNAKEDLYSRAVDAARPRGDLYTVDLPDDQIAKMLDWDKPLSQQPENVRKAIEGLRYPHGKLTTPMNVDFYKQTGGEILERLQGNYVDTPQGAASALHAAGIPGIKYLDAGSRAAGEGSRNFVVFPGNEELLKILGRE